MNKQLHYLTEDESVFIEDFNPRISGDFIIYGAGQNGITLLMKLIQQHIPNSNRVLCIADIDKSKQGKSLFSIPIISPNDLEKYDQNTCVIVTPALYCIQITDFLLEMGFRNIFYSDRESRIIINKANILRDDATSKRDEMAGILRENKEKIELVRRSLFDQESIEVFEAKLLSNFYGNHKPLESLFRPNQYFPKDVIHLGNNEVFVDCGAYDGNTALEFFQRVNGEYCYIYSFEPDQRQIELVRARLAYYNLKNVEILNYAVFSGEGELLFSDNGYGASKVSETGCIKVRTISLDSFFSKKECHPSYIKMDIEGVETEALEGCKRIIAEEFPKFAISSYHRITDIFDIPYLFIEMNPKYKVFLRQHGNIYETVCYAVNQ